MYLFWHNSSVAFTSFSPWFVLPWNQILMALLLIKFPKVLTRGLLHTGKDAYNEIYLRQK